MLPKPDMLSEFVLNVDKPDLHRTFGPIDRVNIIVGPNNSRKSRFIRELIRSGSINLYHDIIEHQFQSIDGRFDDLRIAFPPELEFRFTATNGNVQLSHPFNNEQDRPLLALHAGLKEMPTFTLNQQAIIDGMNFVRAFINHTTPNEHQKLLGPLQRLRYCLWFITQYERYGNTRIQHNGIPVRVATNLSPNAQQLNRFMAEANGVINAIDELLRIQISETTPFKEVVPATRVMHRLFNVDDGATKKYIREKTLADTFIHNYGFAGITNVRFHTGQDLYSSIKSLRNDVRPLRTRFDDFEKFVGIEFFGGKSIDIVAKEKSKDILVFIDDKEERLEDLGDGIQALIQITLPLYLADNKSWVFIEEPELHLHPGLLTLFMKTVLNNEQIKKKNLIIFLTTHSNHLLDQSITLNKDISIFTFTPTKKKTGIRNVMNRDLSILDLLGVANSSVFLSKTSIWVEGITDRKIISAYLKAYLKKHNKQYIEDYDYGFFEYAGSNIVHYMFAESQGPEVEGKIKAYFLSHRIWLLADKDSGRTKANRYRQLGAMTNKDFWFTTTHSLEIENTLSPALLKHVMINAFKMDPKRVQKMRFTHTDYRKAKLGLFLKRKGLGSSHYDEKGNLTSAAKIKIAQAVESAPLVWNDDWMSTHAKKLAKSLAEFLSTHLK
ncbi:MAG: AAA family ATPase [Bacteroidetes bacterium]|nr:AAA family ATPase [Bacteroidota bacterium]